MRRWYWTGLIGGIIGLVGLAGCGPRVNLPPMAKVTGTVTLDGRPLQQGTVQFVPDTTKGTNGPPAVGYIGPDGRFTLSTAGVEGAVVGWHLIGVEARQTVDLNQTSWAPSLIPERYNNPQTSGLTAEVKAGQRNEVALELSSQR